MSYLIVVQFQQFTTKQVCWNHYVTVTKARTCQQQQRRNNERSFNYISSHSDRVTLPEAIVLMDTQNADKTLINGNFINSTGVEMNAQVYSSQRRKFFVIITPYKHSCRISFQFFFARKDFFLTTVKFGKSVILSLICCAKHIKTLVIHCIMLSNIVFDVDFMQTQLFIKSKKLRKTLLQLLAANIG